jgi:RimJ/RimL family protein N-acetyltransferase
MAQLPDTVPAGPIELRRWRPHDIDRLMEAIASSLPELRAFMPWAQELPSVDAELEFLHKMDEAFEAGTIFSYGMHELGQSTVVGACGLHIRGPDLAEIGYWVRSDRHRRGYATASARALTAAAFAQLPELASVCIAMDSANLASAGVPPKLGYRMDREEDREEQSASASGRFFRWIVQRTEWAEF